MIVINILVLLLLIAALGTTDWLHDESGTAYIGLWEYCFGGNCVAASDTVGGSLGPNLQAVRVFFCFCIP